MSTWLYSPARKYHKALQIAVANRSQRQQHNQQLFKYLKMVDDDDNDIDDDGDDYVTDDGRHTIKPSDKDQKDLSYKPTHGPTNSPTRSLSTTPSLQPSIYPSTLPTHGPTNSPNRSPFTTPSFQPSIYPSSLLTHGPTNSPTRSLSTTPSFQPSIYSSILPSSFPTTTTPTFGASIIPSFMPSDDCAIGVYYGIQTSINTRILFEYEIKFTQELPDLYLDRVILPYLREVFALSLFVSPPYCGEECVMRRVKFRSENMPTTNQSQNQQLDIRPNLQDFSSMDNAHDNAKELLYLGLINDLMGVGLGPEYDVVNFEKLCDSNVTEVNPTAYESCIRVSGYLVLHHNATTDTDAENIANHTLARLQEGMDQDWYTCNDESLNILDVVWKGGQIDPGIDKMNTDDDAIIIKNVESNKISSSSIALGAALLLVLLSFALFFVRKRFRGIDSDTVISDITGSENVIMSDNSSFVTPLLGSKTTRGWDVVKGGESLVTSYNKTIV